jgi:hypothetical protein
MGHGERRRELEQRFPGWEIWYVPREPDGATWRARPRMLIDANDPEDLAAAIRAADNPVAPDSALLASPRRYAASGRRLGGLKTPAGSAWRRVKARRTRPARRPVSPPRVPPGLA